MTYNNRVFPLVKNQHISLSEQQKHTQSFPTAHALAGVCFRHSDYHAGFVPQGLNALQETKVSSAPQLSITPLRS